MLRLGCAFGRATAAAEQALPVAIQLMSKLSGLFLHPIVSSCCWTTQRHCGMSGACLDTGIGPSDGEVYTEDLADSRPWEVLAPARCAAWSFPLSAS